MPATTASGGLTAEQIQEARERIRKQMAANTTQLGGKGTARRKRRVAHTKPVWSDEKRLQAMLKRMGLSTIPSIEEVVMVRPDEKALYFTKPRVQGLPAANTYVIAGPSELKDYVPPEPAAYSPEMLRQLAASFRKLQETQRDGQGKKATDKDGEDDEDIPDLVENFQSIAEKVAAAGTTPESSTPAASESAGSPVDGTKAA